MKTDVAYGNDISVLSSSKLSVSFRSYLYHADRSYALVLGRPHAIQDDYTCTLPPLNIDDDFSPAAIRNPPPLSSPALMTFVILRHYLASIIGRMVHHFQKVKSPSHYSDVLALDDDLLKFISTLPPHFSLEPDTSLDEAKRFIPVHRFLLITEILFVRVSLHRPYLLRRLSCDRYARSRKACFESAIKDFQVRQAFRNTMPQETRDSLSNAYREFQTAMISGIYLVLHPQGKDADMMHTILDGFLEDHEGVREMDETTRRELKTIEFLKNRASQVAESTSSHGMDRTNSPTIGHSSGEQHSTIISMSNPRPTVHPSARKAFTMDTTSPTNLSPKLPSPAYAISPHYPPSPAVQRLQHTGPSDGTLSSPAGTGSPSGDDESDAQSLLDHWCSTFSGGSTVDATAGMPALSWGGPGGAEFSGWMGPSSVVAGEPPLMTGFDGSDWHYWETLVNQIKTGPHL